VVHFIPIIFLFLSFFYPPIQRRPHRGGHVDRSRATVSLHFQIHQGHFQIHRGGFFFLIPEKKRRRGGPEFKHRSALYQGFLLNQRFQTPHRYHKPAHLLCTSQRSCTPSTLIIPAETTGRIALTNQRHKSKVDNVHLLHSYLFPSFG